MKKLACGCALALVVSSIAALALDAFLPATYEVERAVTCSGSPADLHPYVEDFHRWPSWSAELRDAERIEYGGPAKGVDARLSWRTADAAGAMEIRASDVGRGVWIDREFTGRGDAKVAILFEQVSERETRLVWIERGTGGNRPLRGLASLLTGRAVAPAVEANLEGLRALVARSPTTPVAPRGALEPTDEP